MREFEKRRCDMRITLPRPAIVLATLGTLLPIPGVASQSAAAQRIVVEFIMQGDQSSGQSAPESHAKNTFEEGNIISSSAILDALKEGAPDDRPLGRFQNATLSVSVSEVDGGVLSMRQLAFCRDLDLYADPHAPDHMKARCDDDLFEYSVAGHGISFLRNAKEIATFELSGGIHTINGAIARIPVGN
jgi:hypothetical protein